MSVDVKLGCVENLFTRMMHFKNVGDSEIGHVHQHDHLTLLAKGKLKVTIDGQETEFTAPHMIYIHNDKVRELEALSENTVAYCIHALRDKETGEILDPDMVPKGSIAQALQTSERIAIL